MGAANCCNREEDLTKFTMFNQSRENQIQEFDDMKAKADNNIAGNNLVNQNENY